jgi:hypothetical protein
VSTSTEVLLDEHVSRVFERVLGEHSYRVEQAKDRFGERTVDAQLLRWCAENEVLLLSNNARDFEVLHEQEDHAEVLLVYDQGLPDADPEGLARTVDEVISQYGTDGLANELVDLDAWYDRLHG